MAYTPTGRPVGRPKTKEYKTISLKIPQDLLDRVQRYAGLHRQSVSELIRDGLEWRITEGDPRFQSMPDNKYYGNTELHELARPVHLVDDRMPFDAELPPSAPSPEPPALPIEATVSQPVVTPALGEPGEETRQTEDVVPAYDTSKYALGELCVHRHDYHGTGHSLRRLSDRECLECQKERARAARQRKRQAQPA